MARKFLPHSDHTNRCPVRLPSWRIRTGAKEDYPKNIKRHISTSCSRSIIGSTRPKKMSGRLYTKLWDQCSQFFKQVHVQLQCGRQRKKSVWVERRMQSLIPARHGRWKHPHVKGSFSNVPFFAVGIPVWNLQCDRTSACVKKRCYRAVKKRTRLHDIVYKAKKIAAPERSKTRTMRSSKSKEIVVGVVVTEPQTFSK